MRKSIFALLAVLLLAGLVVAGCGGGDDDTGGSETGSETSSESSEAGSGITPDEMTVGVVILGSDNEPAILQGEGAKRKGEEEGVTVNVQAPQNQGDVEEFNNKVETFVTEGVDAIIMDSYSEQSIAAAERAIESGIPVVNFDVLMPGIEGLAAEIVYDDFGAGRGGAEGLIEDLGGKGKIAVLGSTLYESVKSRVSGAEEVIAENPGIEVVAEAAPDCDPEKSLNDTQDLLQANPEIEGIYGACGGNALGAAQAVKLDGKTGEIFVWGNDGTLEELTAVEKGELAGDISLDSVGLGEQAMEAAILAVEGKPIPKSLETAAFIPVTKDNVKEVKPQREEQLNAG